MSESEWRGRRDPLLTVANSPKIIMGILLAVIGTGSVTYRLFEKGSLGDGVWRTFVTGTTVGYGDISPKGFAQRIVAVLIMIMAILLTQLLTAHVTNRLVRDDNVFTHEEQEELKELMRESIGVLRDVRQHMFTHEEQEELKELMRESIGVLRDVRQHMFTHEEQEEVMGELDEVHALLKRMEGSPLLCGGGSSSAGATAEKT